MNDIANQGELALSRPPQKVAVPIEMVRAQKNAAAAFTLACTVSGLEEKEIYLPLHIDPGYFTNIKKGKATIQVDLVQRFCEIVGNSIYLEWQAFQMGCTLVMIKSEAERRADEAEAKLLEVKKENQLLRQLLIGRAPP